jgi:hypothetical protein
VDARVPRRLLRRRRKRRSETTNIDRTNSRTTASHGIRTGGEEINLEEI